MTKVSQVMHANPVCVTLNETLSKIATKMKEGDFGTVIVKENRKAMGIITDRDIVIRALTEGSDLTDITAKDVMTKTLESCTLSDSLVKAADHMKNKKVRRLVVLDDKQAPVGILSLGDVATSVSNEEADHAFNALKGCSKH